MDGAGGRGERGRRGSRPSRGRGLERGAARSGSRGRAPGGILRAPRSSGSAPRNSPDGTPQAPRREGSAPQGSPIGGTGTLRAPRRTGSAARRARPSRRAPAARLPPARPAAGGSTGGGEAPRAPRSAAPPRASAAVPVSVSRPPLGGPRLREVLSRLSLARQDVSEAAGLVNQVVSQVIQAIRSKEGSFSSVERLGAGSYYEHVKISEPNEFDIMLVMPVARLQLEECDDTGAFYYLAFKRNPKEKYLLKFLDEDGKLSAFKMLQALRDIIKQEVKNIKNVEVTVKRKKAGSPAITLQIKNPPAEISVDIILTLEVQQSWPPSTQDGLKIEQWLGRKVRGEFRNKSLYLVAKQNKKEKVLREMLPEERKKCFRTGTLPETNSQAYYLHKEIETSGEDVLYSKPEWSCRNTWRLSFSHIEKAMMNNHGSSKTCCESDGPKCCRKSCLKLLKYLLERLKMKYTKELEKFCSYHVKTAFFHACVMWPNDTDWHLGDLDHCFQKYLGYFLDCLQKSELPHFFIPQYNLLSPEDKASSHFLSRQINSELNNGFPIFQERY